VINTSSISGVMGLLRRENIRLKKHGVIGITNSTAKAVGDREIQVNFMFLESLDGH